MKAINIDQDEKAVEAALYLNNYCRKHEECKGCMFSFSQVCILKWTKPEGWNTSMEKIFERRKNNAKNKL